MGTLQIAGYSHWASHLINGDPSGLSDEEFAELQAWLVFNGVTDDRCLDCTTEEYFGWPDGPDSMLKGTLVEYTFDIG